MPSFHLVDLILISILNYAVFFVLYTMAIKLTERFKTSIRLIEFI